VSIQFSQIDSPYRGLVQLYELEIGANRGDVSGNPERLAQFVSDCNQALDDFLTIAIPASGTWEFDDSNQSDYPIMKTDLVSGQRDYTFTTDGSGNLVLDIYKVAIYGSPTATTYTAIYPIDELEEEYGGILTENPAGGTPYRYGKMANGIFLDPVPNYSADSGLKLYVNREASYFTVSDTTKKPGVPGNLHKYFYLKPAAEYARRNNLANQDRLMAEVLKMEGSPGRVGTIAQQFARRARDERRGLSMKGISFR
jgi:hypothetical protein